MLKLRYAKRLKCRNCAGNGIVFTDKARRHHMICPECKGSGMIIDMRRPKRD